jgi:hypothetical protein
VPVTPRQVVITVREQRSSLHAEGLIGQPDKMLIDLRNTKGSTQLFAMSMWIVGSIYNHNVLNLITSVCMSQCLVKVEDTARSLLR